MALVNADTVSRFIRYLPSPTFLSNQGDKHTQIAVDSDTDALIFGGKSSILTCADLTSSQTLTNKTITGASNRVTVVSGSGAGPVALTAAQSGATVLFDRAAGIIYTLPAPIVGLYFDFLVTVLLTAAAYEVDTDAGTTFIGGSVMAITVNATPSATVGPKQFQGDGTGHVKISSNATTTGGLQGQAYRLTCVSATRWQCQGTIICSAGAAVASPFA